MQEIKVKVDKKVVLKICNKIAAYVDMSEEQLEILQYVIQCFVEKTVVFMTILLYGYLRNCIAQVIIFYFSCTIIRKHSGGFHMNTFLKCYITSVLLVLGAVELNKFLNIEEYFLIILIINLLSCVLIMKIGCVNNPEMDMTLEEHEYNKAQTRQIMIIIEIIIIASIFLKFRKPYIALCCQAVICCAFFLVLAKVKE